MGKRLTDEEKLVIKLQRAEKYKQHRLDNLEYYKAKEREKYLKYREKSLERDKLYRLNNLEKRKETERRSREKNKDKISEKAKLDRLKNPDKYKIQQRNYLKNNSERAKHNRKIWTEKNIDKIREDNRLNSLKNKSKINARRRYRRKTDPIYKTKCDEWAKKNKDKRRYYTAKRRAALLSATPQWLTDVEIRDIKRIYKHCDYISRKSGIPYDVDHIHPLQGKDVCGLHVPWNLQILESTENESKGNKLLDKYC
jgi:hypothetical protein